MILAASGAIDDWHQGSQSANLRAAAVVAVIAWFGLPRTLQRWSIMPARWAYARLSRRPRRAAGGDPLEVIRDQSINQGGGVYLGATQEGVRHARGQRAVLLLGPPRSGKTSGVIIPALLSHIGPAVSTSTKPDVARATQTARRRDGRVWMFNPTGEPSDTAGEGLRWSPVQASHSWDGALLMARALTGTIGAGTTDRSHWASRAQALLAPLLHAAAVHDQDMPTVVGWVMRHHLDEAGVLLEDDRCSQLAFDSLFGIHRTEDRERSSIFSATADALQAYTSEHALRAARDPNFDPDAFVRSADTVYIHAPAEDQAAIAPVVCGLLSAIRRATYHADAHAQLTRGRVLFALDEVANIAPLPELPQIASEGGGQGLTLLAALQDLSQARARWGQQADGFLTLFGAKLLLPGIADAKTLEAVSVMLGEYDRRVIAHSTPRGGAISAFLNPNQPLPRPSTTQSTQRTRVLSPGEVANIPAGHALHLDATRWELLTITPAHQTEPWRTLTTPAAPTAR